MNTFTAIDLSQLPPPQVVEQIDYEQILAERKAYAISLWPDEEQEEIAARLALESEPLTKLIEENAYREMIWRQRVNEAALANLVMPKPSGCWAAAVGEARLPRPGSSREIPTMTNTTIAPKATFLNFLRVKINKIARSERRYIDRAEEHVRAYAEALADANIITDDERDEFYKVAKQAAEDAVRASVCV